MADYAHRYVTFLSDYGLADEFVGVCHGVIVGIAPEASIIDITHGLPPQGVREGAIVLAQAVQYMPTGVHLAIVDPGVGSDRLPIAIKTNEGSILVGPDNGLLTLAALRLGGPAGARKIENPAVMLEHPSRTFQGRDIFAPAAAHLARGIPLEDLGGEISFDSLVSSTIPAPRRHDDHFHCSVLHVDRFGNLQLNLAPAELTQIGLDVGSMLEVRVEGHRQLVPYGETFSSVSEGELVLTEDSYKLLTLAVNRGNAAGRFGCMHGSTVIVGPPGSGAD